MNIVNCFWVKSSVVHLQSALKVLANPKQETPIHFKVKLSVEKGKNCASKVFYISNCVP